jgi:hypothetical protein
MPISNWIKAHETGFTKYAYVANDYYKLADSDKSNKAFEALYAQWFDGFGLTDNYREYLKAQRRMYMKLADAYIKNDKSILNFYEIEKKALESKYGKDTQINYSELLYQLESELKYQIDPMKLSVHGFFTHLKLMSDRNKVIAKEYKKWQKR